MTRKGLRRVELIVQRRIRFCVLLALFGSHLDYETYFFPQAKMIREAAGGPKGGTH